MGADGIPEAFRTELSGYAIIVIFLRDEMRGARTMTVILQNYEQKNESITKAFLDLKRNHPERLKTRMNFSWSNWGFGIESLEETAKRLQMAGIHFIELHGNLGLI